MSNATSVARTVCHCRTISPEVRTYGSGLTVPGINPIDFRHIFANFLSLLAVNPVVTTVIVSSVTVYVLLVFWARRADRRDVEKVSPFACTVYFVSNFSGYLTLFSGKFGV